MKLSDLPARYQDQAAAQMGEDAIRAMGGDPSSKRVMHSDALLKCSTPDCDFEPTSNLSAMERHSEETKHRRYECEVNST